MSQRSKRKTRLGVLKDEFKVDPKDSLLMYFSILQLYQYPLLAVAARVRFLFVNSDVTPPNDFTAAATWSSRFSKVGVELVKQVRVP
jgi:hypothetical protein